MPTKPTKPKEQPPIKWGASGFTFQPSFYEATKELPEDQRRLVRDAIIEFAFTGKRMSLPAHLSPLLTLCIPNIEASIRNFQSGSRGGRPRKKTQDEEIDLDGINLDDPNLPF